MSDTTARPSTSKLVIGVALTLIGILYTLDSFGLVEAGTLLRFWPVVLIALGLPRFSRDRPAEWFSGIVLVVLGSLLLLRNLHLIRFGIGQLIPLVLVVVGVRIVLQALQGRLPLRPGVTDPASSLSEWVAFGGIERRLTTQEFVGGNVAAFCGGFDVDLRQASVTPLGATIDVFAWWGGGDIRVPPDWDVAVSVLPLFAGYDDKTVHPVPVPGAPVKRLVVTGTLVMGGLTVRN